MASKAGKKKISDESVSQCCSITGCSAEVARRLLDACAGNLEMAINMHLEGNIGEAPSPAASGSGEDDAVRAPIPQRTETLVDEEYQYGFRNKRRKAKSVFDKFRDFQAEAKQLEAAQQSLIFPSTSRTAAAAKKRTLEDLFRPPIDLLLPGSFENARDVGTAKNRWVLVNIQNMQEFPCQCLNRDVWSNAAVKKIVKDSFVFFQVYHDSADGEKYMRFYPFTRWPYVAVIDPRTGEKMASWSELDAPSFIEVANEFLEANPSPEGSTSSEPPAKKHKLESTIFEASEDSQLEAAIRASLNQSKSSQKSFDYSHSDSEPGSDDDLETFTDSDDDNNAKTREKSPLKNSTPLKNPQSPRSSLSPRLSKSPRTAATNSPKRTVTFLERSDSISVDELDARASPQLGNHRDGGDKTEEGLKNGRHKNGVMESDSGSGGDSVESSSCAASAAGQETNGDDDDDSAMQGANVVREEKWKFYLGNEEDAQTSLMLRFPNGDKKQFSIPKSSRLMALVQYVIEEGFSNDRYELLTNFPRRKLSDMDFDQTLEEIGLHPQESVIVQRRT